MPRYVVERSFPEGVAIPANAVGSRFCEGVIRRNAEVGVTWLHSYVGEDRHKTFCVYDAPSADAIREAARRNELPLDRITQVSVLDPYFHF